MKAILTLVSLFLACGPTPPDHLLLTANPAVAESVDRVIAAVNEAAGEPLLGYGTDYWVVDGQWEQGGECGSYAPAHKEIMVVCMWAADLVLIHEIGHVFGLGHSESTESVMFPRIVVRPIHEAAELLVAELRQKRLLVERQ